MCIIIYIPKGENITKNELKDAWNTNPDGAGIAYLKNKKIHVKKGYMDWDFFYEDCKDIIFDDSLERILHLRITSVGKTIPSQTHPFPLTDDEKEFKKLEYTTTTPVLMMNGTLSIKEKKGFNDTATWIMTELHKYNYQLPRLYKVLNKNHCRWAIISPTKITVTDDFIKENGVYYSNLNHLWCGWYKPYKKSKKSKSKKSHFHNATYEPLELWSADDWVDFATGYAWYDPEHDYENDEGCSKCFLYGKDCLRCWIYDEFYNPPEESYTKDYLNTTIYELDSSEAK